MEELTDPGGPYQLAFWNAAQLYYFLQTIPDPQAYTRQLTKFEEHCSGTEPLSHVLSEMYKLLNSPREQPELACVLKWSTDLHHTFTDLQIQNMIELSYKSSICTKIQETNYKIFTRWYMTPSRLHAIFPDASEHCWRCGTDKGTILHIFWTCPKLTSYWAMVQTIAQKRTNFQIPNDLAFF